MAEDKKLEKNAEKEVAEEVKKDDPGIVEFEKPYMFEGNEYNTVDVTGIRKMTVRDAIDIQKKAYDDGETAAFLVTEVTSVFSRMIAAKATGYPIEFFELMPRIKWKQVQAAVVRMIHSQKEMENGILEFDEPYTFDGEVNKDIDLSGLSNMTCMNESQAENRLVREGIMITEPTYNYLYACIMASMATGKPEKFFTGLPIVETLKLKAAVNNPDFFE